MRFVDFLILLVLFAFLLAGVYFLWLNLPTESLDFEQYHANISQQLPYESSQFYTSMRYVDKKISYYLSNTCGAKKKKDFKEATKILEAKTILNFEQSTSTDSEIEVTCSNIGPEPTEKGHFVAGEGGPSVIINASIYSVILSGKIALYRVEECEEPQIALHELLHALGFDHNSNQQSIMYPITNCEQSIDQEIIEEINFLYNQESAADLIIESVTANKSGRYLSFEASIANYGLQDVKSSTLNLIIDNKIIKTFTIGNLDIGAKRNLSVVNLKIPKNTEKITLEVETSQKEITEKNNQATIKIIDNN
jgi:hypothetical protein